jgi:multiple sugar transport system ATP-binding protein
VAGVIFKDIVKRYGDVSVIEGLNLEIRDHEFMVLVGPSGCGKSTALRMIAGLEEITGGTISIHDRVVNDVAPKDRDIAMVFQSYALYPHMTIFENLAFGMKIRGTPKDEIQKRVADAAQILGLETYLERKPKQLSGGQRQRVAVGRAIVRQPAVFLFDEPLSNLDAKLRVQMRAEIKKLQHRLRTTTVYVTHDQIEAMTMGHRVAILNAGKLQQVGTPIEVYARPANMFVAQFIGTPQMSFLPAIVQDAALHGDGYSLPLPPALRQLVNAGDKVIVGIRPEHLLSATAGLSPDVGRLDSVVELTEPLGDEVIVHGRAGAQSLVFKTGPDHLPDVGAKIPLAVELSSLHLFDAATERRLNP